MAPAAGLDREEERGGGVSGGSAERAVSVFFFFNWDTDREQLLHTKPWRDGETEAAGQTMS